MDSKWRFFRGQTTGKERFEGPFDTHWRRDRANSIHCWGRYAANEEIAAYIKDTIEDELDLTDQTPMSFDVPAGKTRHCIVTFEKPRALKKFDVEVEVFRDHIWRLHYEKQGQTWVNSTNTTLIKYSGRG